MESRSRELTAEAGKIARDAQNEIRETTEEAVEKAKAAGAAAWERAQAAYQVAQEKAVAGAKAADQTIRDNPYTSLGIAFGVGLLVGFLIKRK